MVTRSCFFLLLLAAYTLAATLQRVPNPESLSRERRQYYGGQYAGSSSFSGVDGGVPYGGGSYSLGTLGPQGFVGYTGNFGNPFPNFVTPNLFPAVPYIANNPFDISSLYNAYFNALQAQQQNLQNQLIQLSNVASANQGGGGLLAINTASSRPGGASITINAPPDAQIQPIKGPDGNVQGVTVTHQGPDNGGNYVGTFSSSSSSSSNVNGETQSQQSSTLGINNNGLTTFISSHSR